MAKEDFIKQINFSGRFASIDKRYANGNTPYASADEVISILGSGILTNKYVGLTVLVADENDPDYPEAKEYWVQPYDNNGVTAYHLVEKQPQIDTSGFATKQEVNAKQDALPSGTAGQILKKTENSVEWDDMPSIEDGENTAVLLNGTIHVSAVDAQEGESAGVSILQNTGAGGGVNMSFTLPKGADGQNGITPSIDSTTKQWMIGSTSTGVLAEGHNPNRGTYNIADTLPNNGIEGDYLVVVDDTQSTVTAEIRKWDATLNSGAGGWAQTGLAPNDAEFEDGQLVVNTKIDNTQLDHPATNALAKAKDVADKIRPLDYSINGYEGEPRTENIDAHEDDTSGFKSANRVLKSDGTLIQNSNYISSVYCYPAKKGDVFEISIPKTGNTVPANYSVAVSTSNTPTTSSSPILGLYHKVTTARETNVNINYAVEEENTKWLLVSFDLDGGEPTVYQVVYDNPQTGLLERVAALEEGLPSGTGVLDLNPEKEIVEKLKAARYAYSGTTVTFAHISDVHGNTSKFERFIEFVEHYKTKGLIADAVDTGDLTDTLTSKGTYETWDEAYSHMHDDFKELAGFENILLINGNHDTDTLHPEESASESNSYRWLYYIGQHAYEREFKAHAEPESGTTDPWGVTFPTGAGSDDYYPCYYYKDYGTNVRAIFLDVMDWGTTQQAWLNEVLTGARTATTPKHVIIFVHYLNDRKVYAQCSYNGIRDSEGGDADLGTDNNNISFYGEMSCVYQKPNDKYTAIHSNPPTLKTIAANVQDFIDEGGVFVGYVGGHRHYNAVGYLKLYPKQWFVFITSANTATKGHDYPNEGRAVDNFEIVTVNPFRNVLSLIKIGGQYNNKGCHTDTLGIDYEKGCIVSEAYDEIQKPKCGITADRPTLRVDDVGFTYFDTTLGKPIYWDGEKWIDGNGDDIDQNNL